MNHNINSRSIWTIITAVFVLTSCGEEWLEVRSDKKRVVLQRVSDVQALLDNSSTMNEAVNPSLGEVSSDLYFITDTRYNALTNMEQRNAYTWEVDIYEGASSSNWSRPYRQILYANLALEALETVEDKNRYPDAVNNTAGSALFFRSWAFYQLAQLFCVPFNAETARSDLGIPVRLDSDINVRSVRSSVYDTYMQINNDLVKAIPLLPEKPQVPTRPSKAAAYALMAKLQLEMADYSKAAAYADSCLLLHGALIDYNTIDLEKAYPFSLFNDEVIFHTTMVSSAMFSRASNYMIDPDLFNAYDDNDLRKAAFFKANGDAWTFKGNYTGNTRYFSGIASDEVYLISAEAYTRSRDLETARDRLTTLLAHRYSGHSYGIPPISDEVGLMKFIINERKKELLFRGIRWADLRRFNKEKEFETTLYRMVDGRSYELPPNDKRYVLPIPDEVVLLTGIAQNIR